MRFPTKEIINEIKKKYPNGCRVRLIKMDDVQVPPIGTMGTVRGIDDLASILVAWDNGSSLSVLYDEDICEMVQAE